VTVDAGGPGSAADAVAAAVRAVPGVHDLHPGAPGEVATYLPGRRVLGVRLLEPGCELHLVVDATAELRTTTDRVRGAVLPLVGAPVHVHVEDVATPDGPT
jgi:hypothetical protein